MSPKTGPLSLAPDVQTELRPLYAFVASRVGRNRVLAEDLTQETLLAALQGTFDPARGPLRAWLFGIALRKISDHQRRSRISNDHLSDAARDLAVRMIREPLPEEWLEREEVRAVVNEALARLPLPVATLLIRKYFEGASVASLSAEQGASAKAIESQLTRARIALHEEIERVCLSTMEIVP
jgi:RNA polymerase sigma-70 factor (ECF subfamily)